MKLNQFLKDKDREAFARQLGITTSYLNNLASKGKYQCGIRTAIRIVEATNGAVTLADLLPKKDVNLVTQLKG